MESPIRVVIADDHALVREGTRELLAKHDDIDVVAVAGDGVEALESIEELLPDVALVDISMPGLGGIEVTRRVKASHPEIPILILPGHDEVGYVRALLEAGAAGYLLKDVGEDELVRAIRAIDEAESVTDPILGRALMQTLGPVSVASPSRWQPPLSDRESGVLKLAARGRSNKQIAVELALSPRTVQVHLGHIFDKLGVASRTEAVVKVLREGWLSLEELG
ncbi:MAG: response regulator [Acidimicrobiales bacterium]